MEMEVVLPLPPAGGDFFNFATPCSSHYFTASSTPLPPFAASVSTPTSPSHASNFFRDLDLDTPIGSPSAVPFRWEERPGIPKSPKSSGDDFEFDFSGQSFNKASLSADELFDDGKIRPLKPPPGFQSNFSSPRSPKLSPRNKNDIEDPFEAALIKETRSHSSNYELYNNDPQKRGRRDNKISYISSNFPRKATRSLSPFRISSENTAVHDGAATAAVKPKASPSFLSAISFPKANRSKWRLRDFLFRSASEGRTTEKANYVVMSEKMNDDIKNSSFWSADGGGSSGSSRFHFTAANRVISEELKKKSFLPHKPGLLGRCLRFNRSGMQEMSRGIGSLTRG